MLSVLFPTVDWQSIDCVGFDLDGTLYDELDFISQAYKEIVEDSYNGDTCADAVFTHMISRWMEKGSSYSKIFDETYDLYGVGGISKAEFIEKALEIFRNVEPSICLPVRSEVILQFCCDRVPIFLVSDGNPKLQRRKFEALGLDRFFREDYVVFTGEIGGGCEKPNPTAMDRLAISTTPNRVVFFGDRNTDKQFCANVGCQFIEVYNMQCKVSFS